MKDRSIVLGAGVTGLAVGMVSGFSVIEASDVPGGICHSYYIKPQQSEKIKDIGQKKDAYRFENGGGHWIFGTDDLISSFINTLSSTKSYVRKSAVYFSEKDLYVPYPLQNYLSYLPKKITQKALKELVQDYDFNKSPSTLAEWLEMSFGKTLCEFFFFPFHELYTAGLYTKIVPQDQFKTPVDKKLIIKGIKEKIPAVGYNATFVYPKKGLDDLIGKMANKCNINYNKRVIKIDAKKKEVLFEDGSDVKYNSIISTLPLNKMIELAGLEFDELQLPYTSVLVINIGGKRGDKCPHYHWIYIPKSKSGFHRIGFYSNIDNSFLPVSSRKDNSRVSIYVEKCYIGGNKPNEEEIKKLCSNVIEELQGWSFIDDVEIVDSNWINVAYTWQYPNSKWKDKALSILKKHSIYQIGRYGKWHFQGILDSIKDGLLAGASLRGQSER